MDYREVDYREVDYREVGARRQAADDLMLRPAGSVTRAAGRGEDIAAVADLAAVDIVVALRVEEEVVAVGVDMREAVALVVAAGDIIRHVSQLLWTIDEISSG